jgi:hypothetical protein
VAAGITLTSTAAKELPINPPGLVSFGGNNMQAAALCYPWRQTDICPPAGHIRCHYNAFWLTGTGDNIGLCTILPGIEHLVREASRGQAAT